MKGILKDWCDFCEGKKDFDKSHFLTLFHEDIDESYLKEVFKFFPNIDELIKRMSNIRLHHPVNRSVWEVDPSRILNLVAQDIREKRKACERLSEDKLVDAIDRISPRFVSDLNEFEKARYDEWNGEFSSQVGYYFDECWINDDDKYYALFEAFYGVTNSYEIQWYLGKPLMDTDVNPDWYYNLWKIGGDYALTEKELIVSQRLPVST